ncbi:hypothetical protein JOC34_000627 [Virgibacillus halotolerans]|uniref:hypothetical protein n=1 Tax=Virgibacillus halotolerans TaxID=1071053 RepID=UPI00195FD96B|nr:hypothetical protein [Virgibacillus halotolerans]MBM7598270.1 hypothetical protein [Virgibacillus halotolerans]
MDDNKIEQLQLKVKGLEGEMDNLYTWIDKTTSELVILTETVGQKADKLDVGSIFSEIDKQQAKKRVKMTEIEKTNILKQQNINKIAEGVLGYTWDEDKEIWKHSTGWTNFFNPFDANDDCEKVKEKLREDGWLITIQDKVDYLGDYISSGKLFHKSFKTTDTHYTEALNDRYTVCYLALKAYKVK